MNFVTIDPSLISTALCINGKLFNYAKESNATNKSGLEKWYALCEPYVTYRWIDSYVNDETFSKSEIDKLNNCGKIVKMIIDDILANIIPNERLIIAIEGYSYSSEAGFLIDLVTFGTTLRTEILKITQDLIVLPPSTLKLEAAKLTYPMVIEKKKEVWRNKEGLSGGSFKKHDMYKVLTENEKFTDPWVNFLREVQSDVFSIKAVKKPIEDINDAVCLYNIIKINSEKFLKGN